jgi:pantoate--beta-alanine ligase
MIIYRDAAALSGYLEERRSAGATVGFVPTMGALHEGHLQLARISLGRTDLTVCSIFVNPTQFNDPKDLEKYPVTVEKDIQMLEATGVNILFLPDRSQIYPDGTGNLPHYELGRLETLLEGKYRPGHFQGVCQVVHRLLLITRPDILFMGRKDYQQCMVCRRLIELESLPVQLEVCDTIREESGLAMSSRNMRLSASEKERAPVIHRVLTGIRRDLRSGSIARLRESGLHELEAGGLRPDYLEICHAHTLEPVSEWDGKAPLVALVAAYLGEVRLIDNIELTAGS